MQNPKGSNNKQLSTDLRKSHFEFGHTGPKAKVTEYNSKFQPKPTTVPENQGDKLNVRASHFSLGTGDGSKGFRTTAMKDFKVHEGFVPPTLAEEKQRDLRTHHFSLGTYKPQYSSLSHTVYQEKFNSIDKQREEQEVARAKMIKHNHVFAETDKNQFSSEYNKNFNKELNPEVFKQGYSAEQLKQKVVELRKSHVILGEDYKPMQTVSQKDYRSKNTDILPPANDNVAIRKTNFVLGNNPTEYETVNSSFYVQHPAQGNDNKEVFQALRSDLRAHHFNFGGGDSMYATETMASYKKHPEYKTNTTLDPNLYQNHWTIGDSGAQMMSKTSYTNAHKDFGKAAVTQARDQTQDRGSSWKLGNQKVPWVTESKSHFTKQEGGPQVQDASLKGNLRASHFKFDDVKTNQFKSISQSTYVPKHGLPSTLNEDLKNDLRTHHFKYGTTNHLMVTSTQLAYKPTDGKPSNLDPTLAKELRSHHFTYGDGKWQPSAVTEYRNNFAWKMEGDN